MKGYTRSPFLATIGQSHFSFLFSLLSLSPVLHVALSRNADTLCIYCRKTLLIKAPQHFFPAVSSIDSFPVKLLFFCFKIFTYSYL